MITLIRFVVFIFLLLLLISDLSRSVEETLLFFRELNNIAKIGCNRCGWVLVRVILGALCLSAFAKELWIF